jgi:predicted PurR-regulated permease PerM
MATNRIIPPAPEQLQPADAPKERSPERELEKNERRKLRVVLRAGAMAQLVVATAVILAICYVAKLVLVTLMIAVLLAFVLEPIVSVLERFRLPRALGALAAVLLLLAATYDASYFFYNRAVSFAHELPKYSEKIRGLLSHVREQTRELEKTTQQVLPADDAKNENDGEAKDTRKPLPVKVENPGGPSLITQNVGAVTEVVLTLLFIPFLVYFMLSWQEHTRTKSVLLFRPENRTTAYVTIGKISVMLRSFIAGNFVIGLFMSVCSLIVFGLLGLPYFYFLGFISGFLSLMPYLGILLAMLPPLAAGMGVLGDTGLLIIAATVLGLHLLAMNVLYPKILGKRLQLNPLVVTISLLVWGFIWGAMGLVLAVPIMAAIKIICDHVTSLQPVGEWMGE